MMLKDQLAQIIKDLSLVSVESSLIVGACLLLVVGLFSKHQALLKLIFLSVLLVAFYFSSQHRELGTALSDSIILTELGTVFHPLLILIAATVVIFPRREHVPEFYFMILSLLVGSLFMIKANSLLIVYLAVELVSYVSYALTAFSFNKKGSESAIKYLLFGAFSSAILLIGIGLTYGFGGSLYISDYSLEFFKLEPAQIGLLFMFFGVFFKASIFPFHIWTPAVYQSAPVDSVAVFSVIPKLSGFVLLYQLLSNSNLSEAHWIIELVILLGIVTVLVGTFGAIMQSNTRRMIAFGSIAHSGFLLAFLIPDQLEIEAFYFYGAVYAIMNVGAFYLVDLYERNGIFMNTDYSSLKGQSLVIVAFTLILISLVGIPPLSGFTAKFFLFTNMWQWYQDSQSTLVLTWLLVAVFATLIALFYYLRIPYFYFLKNSTTKMEGKSIEIGLSSKIIATLFGVTLLLLFFVPKLVV